MLNNSIVINEISNKKSLNKYRYFESFMLLNDFLNLICLVTIKHTNVIKPTINKNEYINRICVSVHSFTINCKTPRKLLIK